MPSIREQLKDMASSAVNSNAWIIALCLGVIAWAVAACMYASSNWNVK